MTTVTEAQLKRRLRRADRLLEMALNRLDFLNTGTYEEIGPDEIAESIRRYCKRHGLDTSERPV